MVMLTPENVKLKRNIFWDVLELDWNEVNMTLNGNRFNLPKSVTITFTDIFKIRCSVKREPCLFHIISKQDLTWFILASNNPQETV